MQTDPAHREAGFTLLEMIIVLMIAALVFGVGALGLSALKGRVNPGRLSEDLVDLFDSARLRAHRDQSLQTVVIDLEAKAVFVRGGHYRILIPADYSVSVVAGREIVADAKAPEIRFSPDGTSSGGEIVISSPAGAQAQLEISWLTGLARMSDASP